MAKYADVAKNLNKIWAVDCAHPLYSKTGKFYNYLIRFPGAYFDDKGFLIFKNEKEYLNCRYLSFGKRVNVPRMLSQIPGYIKVFN